MEPFATADDLEKRWRVLTDSEKTQAGTLLGDATSLISAKLSRSGIPASEIDENLLESICCNVVKRSMMSGTDEAPMSQFSNTVGPFAASYTYANPTGDIYLTSAEKTALGINRQRVGSLRPALHDWTGAVVDGW
jgi:hypothetical protein